MTLPLVIRADQLARGKRGGIEAIVRDAVPRVAPTLALAAWQGGKPMIEINAGWMDPERRRHPTGPDALFDLASITKTVTATLFLQQVSAGRVDLDDPIVSLIPELGEGGPRAVDGAQEPLTRRVLPTPPERVGWTVDPNAVTFRHLLTHTSGLAPWRAVFEACGPVPAEPPGESPVPPADRHAAGLRAVVRYPFVDRVGRAFHYSDLGFMLLGESVRRLADDSLDGVVRSRLAAPLGLSSLVYRPLDAGIYRERVVPTSVDELWRHRRCWAEVEDENCAGMGGIAGHAGLFATSDAVARFGHAWLEGAPVLGIDADVAAEATNDQTSGLDVTRGLCWQLRGERPGDEDAAHLAPLGPGAFGHTGFTGTSLAIDRSRQLVVVLLTNRVHASRSHAGIDELRRDIHEAIASSVGGPLDAS